MKGKKQNKVFKTIKFKKLTLIEGLKSIKTLFILSFALGRKHAPPSNLPLFPFLKVEN